MTSKAFGRKVDAKLARPTDHLPAEPAEDDEIPIVAVQPRRLYRQVADQLRQLIDDGEFPPETRLPPERDLAAQLKISRPTVREALIALEVEGRVSIRGGSGIYVTSGAEAMPRTAAPDTVEGPFELLRARAFIEGAIAAEAARLATQADIAALDDVLTRMQSERGSGDPMIRLDRAFHTGVAGILGNAVLVRFIGDLFDQRINPYFERLAVYFEDSDTWRTAVAEHAAIRDAIAAHGVEDAKAAMQAHLRLSQERFSRNFGEAVEGRSERSRR